MTVFDAFIGGARQALHVCAIRAGLPANVNAWDDR